MRGTCRIRSCIFDERLILALVASVVAGALGWTLVHWREILHLAPARAIEHTAPHSLFMNQNVLPRAWVSHAARAYQGSQYLLTSSVTTTRRELRLKRSALRTVACGCKILSISAACHGAGDGPGEDSDTLGMS